MGNSLLSSNAFPVFRLNIIACYLDPDNTRGSWSAQGTARARETEVEHMCKASIPILPAYPTHETFRCVEKQPSSYRPQIHSWCKQFTIIENSIQARKDSERPAVRPYPGTLSNLWGREIRALEGLFSSPEDRFPPIRITCFEQSDEQSKIQSSLQIHVNPNG